jgi:hypothetical protein
LFRAFDTTQGTEVQLIFERHVKAWAAWSYYSSMKFDIQHWIDVSVQCDFQAGQNPPQQPGAEVTLIS